MPMITFSGVRNSWLMPCRNSGTDWSCVRASRGICAGVGESSVVGFTMPFSKRYLNPFWGQGFFETSLETSNQSIHVPSEIHSNFLKDQS